MAKPRTVAFLEGKYEPENPSQYREYAATGAEYSLRFLRLFAEANSKAYTNSTKIIDEKREAEVFRAETLEPLARAILALPSDPARGDNPPPSDASLNLRRLKIAMMLAKVGLETCENHMHGLLAKSFGTWKQEMDEKFEMVELSAKASAKSS